MMVNVAALTLTALMSAPAATPPPPVPVRLTLQPREVRCRIAGVGGNYYSHDDEAPGMTRYSLDHLNVSMARVRMRLREWEPANDNGDPKATDLKALAARDAPGSKLRRDFLLQGELARKKVPYIISVFRLPDWMYTKKPTRPHAFGNRIAPGKWPEVLECIGSYLKHAKDTCKAEADYFSFNEPAGGVYVALTAAEHRDAIKRIGPHLASLGLKTKLLLGDNAHIQAGTDYLLPAARDAEAMKHVGAVSFHSYRMTPPQYRQWAELADRLKLPLLAAEVGVDPGAYGSCRKQDFGYALREMVMVQELLLHARPRALLYWEYGGSCWSLLRPAGGGRGKLKMSERFCFQKHWCDFIPPGSEAVATGSDGEGVLFTAFRHGRKGGAAGWTLHVGNRGDARPAHLVGLGGGVKTLNRVCTRRGVFFKPLAPLAVADAPVELDLPARSLTTLTTLPVRPP